MLVVKSVVLAVSVPPIEVATVTAWVAWASPVRVTVKVIAPPSVADAEAIANTGEASSLVIVPETGVVGAIL